MQARQLWDVVSRAELEHIFPQRRFRIQQLSVVLHSRHRFDATIQRDAWIYSKELLPAAIYSTDANGASLYKCIILPRSTLVRHGVVWFSVLDPLGDDGDVSIVDLDTLAEGEYRRISLQCFRIKPNLDPTCTRLVLEKGAPFAQMLILKRSTHRALPQPSYGLYYSNRSTICSQLYAKDLQRYADEFTKELWMNNIHEKPLFAKDIVYIQRSSLYIQADGEKMSKNVSTDDPTEHGYTHVEIECQEKISIEPRFTGFAIWSNTFRKINEHLVCLQHGSGIWDPGFCGRGRLVLRVDETDRRTKVILPSGDAPVAMLLLFAMPVPLASDQCYNGTYQEK